MSVTMQTLALRNKMSAQEAWMCGREAVSGQLYYRVERAESSVTFFITLEGGKEHWQASTSCR